MLVAVTLVISSRPSRIAIGRASQTREEPMCGSAASETGNQIRSRREPFVWDPQRSHSGRIGREEADWGDTRVSAGTRPLWGRRRGKQGCGQQGRPTTRRLHHTELRPYSRWVASQRRSRLCHATSAFLLSALLSEGGRVDAWRGVREWLGSRGWEVKRERSTPSENLSATSTHPPRPSGLARSHPSWPRTRFR